MFLSCPALITKTSGNFLHATFAGKFLPALVRKTHAFGGVKK
jgi:hypothetical protein